MPTEQDFAPGTRRVLLMERDAAARRAAASVLRALSSDLEVKAPADAFEAGRLLYSFEPHLVLFDLDDPKLDWSSAWAQVRRTPGLSHIRAAGATRRLTVEAAEAGEKAGLLDVLSKPLEAAALRALLRHAFPYLRLCAETRPRRASAGPKRSK